MDPKQAKSGNIDSGNITSLANQIFCNISITFISIPSNMGM